MIDRIKAFKIICQNIVYSFILDYVMFFSDNYIYLLLYIKCYVFNVILLLIYLFRFFPNFFKRSQILWLLAFL